MLVSDLANRKADINFFAFRSTVIANDIDLRFFHTTLSLEFSLKISHSFSSNDSEPAQDFTTITAQNVHTTTKYCCDVLYFRRLFVDNAW